MSEPRHPTNQLFTWILYDGRAESGDTDDASVLEAFSSRRDLRNNLYHWRGHDGVLFEYDVQNGNELVNERMIGHLREGKAALLAKCSRREADTRFDRSLNEALNSGDGSYRP